MQRIYAEYIAGRGKFAIAEALTCDGILSPSSNDPTRNRHRTGIAWAKGAVAVILTNPRYTGRQVWNKQRKDEVLIDVEDVGLGHETKLRWNTRDKWIFSEQIVREPIIDVATFQRAQEIAAAKGVGRKTRERNRTQHRYVLRGLLHCGICGRRMQGQKSREQLFYRCRYPNEYGLANKTEHPATSISSRETSWDSSTAGSTPASRRTDSPTRSRNATELSDATAQHSKPAPTRLWSPSGSPKPKPAAPKSRRASSRGPSSSG
ncbi:recombinase family protein [Amycolatopsis sp. NPDC004625]|uniref:recombinase family protein n=1 Tax=Amycolatopsis sp. NPDC004625 TaxID=3154670 RepID=UPI0033BA1BDF